MFDYLPDAVRTELEIIRKQDSAKGAIKFLRSLLDQVAKDEKTAKFIADIESRILEHHQQEEVNKTKAIKWIKGKITKVQKHPSINHSLIQPSLKQLNKTLSLKNVRLDQNYIIPFAKNKFIN